MMHFELLLVLQLSVDVLTDMGWTSSSVWAECFDEGAAKPHQQLSDSRIFTTSTEKYLCLCFPAKTNIILAQEDLFFLFSPFLQLYFAVVLTGGRIAHEYLYVSLNLSHFSCSGVRV